MSRVKHFGPALRHARGAFALLLGLLVCSATGQAPMSGDLQPVLATSVTAPAIPPRSLRIVSFNVHYAPEPLKLAEALRQSKELARADVLLIQEIEDHAGEGSSRTARLAAALKLNYTYAPARATDDGGTHGLAILSRFPLRDVEVISLPQYNLRFNARRRIALAATLDVGETPLRVYNLHLDTRLNPAERREQLRPVAERARADAILRVVVGGDFNTSPFRWLGHVFPIFRVNQAGALDQFMAERGFGTQLASAGPTSRRGFFRFRLDSIYTRGLQVRASGVAHTVRGSDHVPVWVEVSWP